MTLRAKSAGSRVASHKRKSTHLANKGAFVGGGFSLCTSAANLGWKNSNTKVLDGTSYILKRKKN